MKPEGSLPCSQEPSIGSYPEPDQSNPHHPILTFTLRNQTCPTLQMGNVHLTQKNEVKYLGMLLD
jgi:hypothetical protein